MGEVVVHGVERHLPLIGGLEQHEAEALAAPCLRVEHHLAADRVELLEDVVEIGVGDGVRELGHEKVLVGHL